MKRFFQLLLLLNLAFIKAQNTPDSLLQKGHYLNAIEWINLQEETANKNIDLGRIYYDIGSYNKAIFHYHKALSTDSTLKTKIALAKTYNSDGNYRKAIHYYKNVIEEDSLNYLILYKLGKLYAKTDQHQKAIRIFEKLHKIDPKNPNYPYQKALQLNNLYERANLFLEVFDLDSLHTKSMYHLANFFSLIRDKDSSRLFIDKALKINPDDTKFLHLKISDLYKQKKYQSALDYALLLDSLSLNNLFAKQRIGLSFLRLKDYKQAENYLMQAISIDHKEKTNYYYLGLLHKELKDYKKAKFYFKNAIHLDKPDVDNEYYNLGLIAQDERQPKEAINHFRESYKNNPKNYLALFEMAVMSDLYYKDKSIAKGHYKEYLERFKVLNKEKTSYITKRLKEIEEKLFLEGRN